MPACMLFCADLPVCRGWDCCLSGLWRYAGRAAHVFTALLCWLLPLAVLCWVIRPEPVQRIEAPSTFTGLYGWVCCWFCTIKIYQQLLRHLLQQLLQLPEATLPHNWCVAAFYVRMRADAWGCAALQMAWKRVLPPCVWQRGSLLNRAPVIPALKCMLGQAACAPAAEVLLACCFIAQAGAVHSPILKVSMHTVFTLCCLQWLSADCTKTLWLSTMAQHTSVLFQKHTVVATARAEHTSVDCACWLTWQTCNGVCVNTKHKTACTHGGVLRDSLSRSSHTRTGPPGALHKRCTV
jgi:hypothetical protein